MFRMQIPKDLLELLEMQNPAALAQDAQGRFPLAEIDEAIRDGAGSIDLVEWFRHWREVRLRDATDERAAASELALQGARAKGTRMDAPPLGDVKNYEQGPA
jgi:hypothetical protein